jgi:hypothetical protein
VFDGWIGFLFLTVDNDDGGWWVVGLNIFIKLSLIIFLERAEDRCGGGGFFFSLFSPPLPGSCSLYKMI